MYVICKLLYIAMFALLSSAQPYLPLYYGDVLKFSSNQIGLVLSIAPFIQSIACPFWSFIVDKRPKLHGPIMAITSLLGGVAIMSIMLIGHQVAQITELSNVALVTVTSVLALTFAFFTLPNISLVDSAVMKILGPNKILYGEQRLWGSVAAGLSILIVGQLISITNNYDMIFYVFAFSTILFIVFSFFANVNSYVEEPVTPDTLDEPSLLEHNVSYADIVRRKPSESHDHSTSLLHHDSRTPINTYQTIVKSPTSDSHYQHYVELYKPSSLASAYTIREEADETLNALGHLDLGLSISRIASVDQSIVAGLVDVKTEGIPTAKNIFSSFRVFSFLVTTLLFGFVLSIIQNFLFLFLNRDLNMPASWIGWTGPTTAITELLCFCFTKQLTEIFGVTYMMLIAHTVTIVRCLCYTLLPADSLFTNISALVLQTLQGIGFGIFWATSVSEIDGFFPPEQRAVAQGILGALHFGLGTGLGALGGGYLYEYLGAIAMFQVNAFIAALSVCIFCVGRSDRFK